MRRRPCASPHLRHRPVPLAAAAAAAAVIGGAVDLLGRPVLIEPDLVAVEEHHRPVQGMVVSSLGKHVLGEPVIRNARHRPRVGVSDGAAMVCGGGAVRWRGGVGSARGRCHVKLCLFGEDFAKKGKSLLIFRCYVIPTQ